jgi:hypothetical protein
VQEFHVAHLKSGFVTWTNLVTRDTAHKNAYVSDLGTRI